MKRRCSYAAYGLRVHSELPLPELAEHPDASVDVVVRLGEARHEPGDHGDGGELPPRSQLFDIVWNGIGKSIVRGGREIVLEPGPGVDERTLRLYLLGALLPVVLYQRGFLVLHASAVELDGRAVAFLGESGCGKSTLAVALQACGHRLLSDDVVPVWVDAQEPWIRTGPPSFKLWPDSARALGIAFDQLPLVHPDMEKRWCVGSDPAPQRTLQLDALYVLDYGRDPAIDVLDSSSSLLEVARHSFVRFQDGVVEAGSHLRQSALLAGRVPAFRLRRERGLVRLSQAVRALEEHRPRDRRHAGAAAVG
jgi:hypothetical protein